MRKAALVLSLAIVIAAAVADRSTGLDVTYYRDLQWTSQASATVDHVVGSDSILQDAPFTPNVPFSAFWSGYLFVPRTGDYEFSVTGYGDVSLSIGPPQQGLAGSEASISSPGGTVHLESGAHAIAIAHRHPEGLYGMDVRIGPAGGSLERLSLAALSRHPHGRLVYGAITSLRAARTLVLVAWAFVGFAWIARRVRWVVLVPLVCTTAAFTLGVIYDWPNWLRGPAPFPPEWQWLRVATVVLLGATPVIVVTAAVAVVLAVVARGTGAGRRVRVAILCAPLAAFAFQVAALHLQAGGAAATIEERATGGWYNSFFLDAVRMRTGVATFISTYPTLLPSLSLHGSVHPPGPALYYRAIVLAMERRPGVAARVVNAFVRVGVERDRLTEPGSPSSTPVVAAALVGGLSVIAFGALTAWPIAAMVALAGGDGPAAASASLLWAFCPAMAFFASEFNQVIAFLTAACGAFALAAMRAHGRVLGGACALASGIAAGLALFCSFGAVPVLGAVGAVVIVVAVRSRQPVTRGAVVLGFSALGIAAVFAVPTAVGYNHLAVARDVLGYQLSGFNPRRSGDVWLAFNLLDFSIFAGWPLVAWGAVVLVRLRGRAPLLWTVLAAVVALDLADVTRGEVGRLWMPLTAPLYVAVVVSAMERREAKHEPVLVAVLLAVATVTVEIFWLARG